ncbi:endo alpha-1,4 polygalactosaminidase [Raineyella sp. W15-4]|uniref:endo alpha-1,4 polygalactosaminidase n=1 Tax=Raineyella sp. W15-4 TaxID=3081651 RepID=UPI003988C24D
MAHARGLSIGLKNSPDLVDDLVGNFDFAVVEQCYEFDECDAYVPFIDRGKAVLHVEYNVPVSRFCPTTTDLGFSSMRKRLSLNAWRQVCP